MYYNPDTKKCRIEGFLKGNSTALNNSSGYASWIAGYSCTSGQYLTGLLTAASATNFNPKTLSQCYYSGGRCYQDSVTCTGYLQVTSTSMVAYNNGTIYSGSGQRIIGIATYSGSYTPYTADYFDFTFSNATYTYA